MSVVESVGIELGRPLSVDDLQKVALWDANVRSDIDRQARIAGLTVDALPPSAVDRFVAAAIVRKMRNPLGTDRIEVGIDDGRVVQRFPDGQLEYLPSWWVWLGLPSPVVESAADWSGGIPYSM